MELGQLQIWRNADAGRINAYNWRPKLLPIDWQNAPPPNASFWQLQAELVDGVFKVVTAQGPFPQPPRLEKLPDLTRQQQRAQSTLSQPQLKPKQTTTTASFDWEELTPVSGKLELTIKLSTLPQVKQVDGRCHFKIDCDGRVFQVTVKQKQWAKLETASTTYAQWVAAIAGKLGAATADGFILEEPNIQVFERSGKQNEPQAKASAEVVASQQSQLISGVGAKAEVESSQKEANSLEKPNPSTKTSAEQAEAKPKKIGKFNVQIR